MTGPQRSRRVAGIRPPTRQQAVPALPSRRHPEISAARIAAIAALVGALIGALGAGAPVLISADRQISAENARLLRDQQRAAYAQFMANDDEMYDAVVAYSDMLQATTGLGEDGKPSTEPPLPVPSPDERKAIEQRVQDGLETLNKDVGVVRLVGSREITAIANEIHSGHMSSVVRHSTVRAAESEERRRQDARDLIELQQRWFELKAQFDTQARLDLGTDQVAS